MTQTEWGVWKTHPVTKEFFAYLIQQREEVKEEWANAGFIQDRDEALALGACRALRDIIELEFEDLIDEEGQSVGNNPA